MEAEHNRFRRRHYFIKKDFQFRFILKFCLLLLAGVIISTGLLLLFSQDTLTSSFSNSRLVIEKTAFAIMPQVIYTNLITLGLITIASIVVILLVSHKLAGPLFRFEADLKIIGEGDFTKKIRLRKNDQLKSFVESINNMAESIHKKVTDIQADVETINRLASENEVPDELMKRLNELKARINKNFTL